MLAATAMVLPPELKAHFPQPPCVFCAGDRRRGNDERGGSW